MTSPDKALRRAILASLIADPNVPARHIVVDVADTAVTLSGRVDTHDQKSAAATVAGRIKGVGSVTNSVSVNADSPGKGPLSASTRARMSLFDAAGSDATLWDSSPERPR